MLILTMFGGESVWIGGEELVMTDKLIATRQGTWFPFSKATVLIELDGFCHERRQVKVAFAAPRSVLIERQSVREARLAREEVEYLPA